MLVDDNEKNEALDSNKLIDIWKVHGSIDWFRLNETNKIFAAPLPVKPTPLASPLIVTPGIVKYQTTSSESPFHLVINEAMRDIREEKSYICIGYGFNDSHIQPDLVGKLENRRNTAKSATIIVLAKKLTPKTREIFLDGKIINFLLIEEDGNETKIYTSENKNGVTLPISELWKLEKFLEHFRNI